MTQEARELAEFLSNQLFSDGRFDNVPGGVTSAAPATLGTGVNLPLSDTAFAGISVQAVGYEVGSDESTVHIYVASGSASAIKALQTEHDGISIKASKMASLRINPQLTARSTNRGHLFVRNNRIACGSSCAPSNEQYSGTFGALVRNSNNELFTLSNNHVTAACNHTPLGMPILSPSMMDSHPTLPAPREISRHSSIVELRSGEPNLVTQARVDAAVGLVQNPDAVTSWQGDPSNGYDTPTRIIAPQTGLRVKKWGRTTGLTTGTVEAQLIRLPLPYKTQRFSAVVYFTDVWTIRSSNADSFALPGDSGSLVVTEDGNQAVGLVFATTTTQTHSYGVLVGMDHVLTELAAANANVGQLSLVGNHGV